VSATDTQLEAVRTAVEPAVGALGLDVYDVELVGGGSARTLRLTVTRPGGVDLEAITAVTHAVSPLLDDAPAPAGPFLLEVSSPGVERVLRTPAHYAGAVGSVVSIKLRAESGTRRVHGTLVEAGAEGFTVEVDGAPEQISYADVTQARTVFEWGPQPRPGSRRRAGATASKGVTA
jgi:ribosome maturation factor RimP